MKNRVIYILTGLFAVVYKCNGNSDNDNNNNNNINNKISEDKLVTKYTIFVPPNELYKQKSILELLQHVHQSSALEHLQGEIEQFNLESTYEFYNNVEAIREIDRRYKHCLLTAKNELFSVYNEQHLNEAILLYKVFFSAKDWDIFYKSLIWARFNVNAGVFLYAMNVAILHRNDTKIIQLPPIYEINPNLFFNADLIQTAQHHKMHGFQGVSEPNGIITVIISRNFSVDQPMEYFTHDVGLSEQYRLNRLKWPTWYGGNDLNVKDFKENGERHLLQHQQLIARYYLERLSNDAGVIPNFFIYSVRETSSPKLRYYNGVYFPGRESNHNFYTKDNYDDIHAFIDYERRIREAIDIGHIVLPNGTYINLSNPDAIKILGNTIMGNPDSPNLHFYGNYAMRGKVIFGGILNGHHNHHNKIPTLLEHFETTLIDPIFYQLYQRILKLYWRFKNLLKPYTRNELDFPGVKINNVSVGKLMTYFEQFQIDITNAVDVDVLAEKNTDLQKLGRISNYKGKDFVILAKQHRLNHDSFNITLEIFAEKKINTHIQIYIGPKYNQTISRLNENRQYFVMLDDFRQDFVAGQNIVIRNSNNFTWCVEDKISNLELYKKLLNAFEGKEKYRFERKIGFPHNLLLPKGKRDGMPFQLFVNIIPFSSLSENDIFQLGYPLDRRIDKNEWPTPNMFFKDVDIFHEGVRN